MTIEERYNFIASIKGIGAPPRGQGWMLTLDYRWPNSKYDLVLYGQDWQRVNGWQVGTSADITIERGNLKNGKSGQYHSDFFWNLVDIKDPDFNYTPATYGASPGKSEIAQGPDPLQTRIAWNSAVNNAVHLIGPVAWPEYRPEALTAHIRCLATDIYSIITAGPPAAMPLEAAEMDVEAPPAPEPTRTEMDPVEALRQSVRQWNYDHAEQVIGGKEIQRGLDALFGIKTENTADGVALLTPDQLLTMQGLIARGEYFDKIQSPELRF